MTTTRHPALPPTAQWGPFVFMQPPVGIQFRAYRQARPHLETGTLLGAVLPAGNQILLTQALCWSRSDLPLRPFAVGASYQQLILDLLNLREGSLAALTGERLQMTQIGHWMVMPSVPLQDNEPPFAPTAEVCARELAVLEHAVQVGWLQAPEFVLAIREEGGQTRVRAYVLKPGLPVCPVYFDDDELNHGPAVLTQEDPSEQMAADSDHWNSK